MTNIILIIVTGLYLIESIVLAKDSQYGLALSFLAYAIANLGLLIASKGI